MQNYIKLVLIYLPFHCQYLLAENIVISEVLSSNQTINQDLDFSKNSDWIELYNNTQQEIDLGGYYLTDDIDTPNKWPVPAGTVISAESHLLFWADDKDTGLHTNFKISSGGEFIGLYDAEQNLVHSIDVPELDADISYGLIETTNSSQFVYWLTPTPELENKGDSYAGISAPVVFDQEEGVYTSSIELSLSNADGDPIYYSLDGSEPTTSSILFEQPITLDSNVVVKAVSIPDNPGFLQGAVEVKTFLFNVEHQLPIITIAGVDQIDVANMSFSAEAKINVAYYDKRLNKQFSQYANIKSSGASSALGSGGQRSFKLKADYGDKYFDYQLYPEKDLQRLKSFRLRNAGQDGGFAFLADAFASRIISTDKLVEGMQFEGYRPAVVYIDGQYYGLMNIREDDDKDYVEHNFGINGDNVRFDIEDELTRQMSSEQFDVSTEAGLANIESLYDVIGHMNTIIVGTYLDDGDFYGVNVPIWKDDSNPNSRWEIPNHDRDQSFSDTRYSREVKADDVSVFYFAFAPEQGHPVSRLLYQTQTYRAEFLQRYMAFINVMFQPKRSIAILNSIKESIRSEMDAHGPRWVGSLYERDYLDDKASWEENTGLIESFLEQRAEHVIEHIKTTFSLATVELKIEVNDALQGSVYVHDIRVKDPSLTGKFFADLPVQLEAKAAEGYEFSHWEGALSSEAPQVALTLQENSAITAVFKASQAGSVDLVINEVQAKNLGIIVDEFGDEGDWIEIKNQGDTDVDLAGYYLSDDEYDLTKFQIPSTAPLVTTIPALSTLLLWADKDTEKGENHLNFKLSSSGESLYLIDKDGQSILDSMSFKELTKGYSYARFNNNGTVVYQECVTPTPNDENRCVEGFTMTLANAEILLDENATYVAIKPVITGTAVGHLTYTLEGADSQYFNLLDAGALSFNYAQDFEQPSDSNQDNRFEYTLIATDEDGNKSEAAGSIVIQDVAEGFTMTLANAEILLDENATYVAIKPVITGTAVGHLTYTLEGADSQYFNLLDAGALSFNYAQDFEQPGDSNQDNRFEYTLIATDEDGNTSEAAGSVVIQDVAEGFTMAPSILQGLLGWLFGWL